MAGSATRWSTQPAQLLTVLLLPVTFPWAQAGLPEILCALLGDPELCRNDDGARSQISWEAATTNWGPFQPIADTSDPPPRAPDMPWRPGRVVIKGKRTAHLKPDFGANHSLPSPETREALEIDFDNVTYSVDDPMLPWKILEYFANLQVEVSYVENVGKRKAYSDYLFRKMNIYLYSVAGADATVKLAPQGYFSPEFFVWFVNKLSMFLVLVMTGMLLWFIGFLAYWYYGGGTDSSPTLPLYACIVFGVYAASVVIYRVLTFNNCEAAAAELKKQIVEAREDLKKRGYKFD
ncbi:hypothetical protein HPB52_010318 [Rhipicephalus sanguineus]|uniref:Dolichol-phosphate mannose synthase subunit 3 n=1 Tax=Rhipicephalus sanguineus TaxID=34632 RepID=A0A9D4T5I9_RHISA|nr:hypothetical protein HPB52_010318 [Rhipicephalus sanguineus]